MMNRLFACTVAGLAFVMAAGLSPKVGPSAHVSFEYPAPAYAAGSCSLAPLVCANDSSPGCETICGGGQQASCVEGTCSAAGNLLTPNRCTCK
jgi:hypothetical protein